MCKFFCCIWNSEVCDVLTRVVNQLELLVLCTHINSIYHLQILPQAQVYLPIDPHIKVLLFGVLFGTRGQHNTGTKLRAALITRVRSDLKPDYC